MDNNVGDPRLRSGEEAGRSLHEDVSLIWQCLEVK